MNIKKEYTILIIYDISNDKTRNKIFHILSGYGHNIQKSAFLCILTNLVYKNMLLALNKIRIEETDSIYIYKLFKFKSVIIGKQLNNLFDKNYIIL